MNIRTEKGYDMKDLYELNERSKVWDMFVSSVCEDSVPYIVDEVEEENKIHNKYDKGYKYLFSVKKNFIDFVRIFMKIHLKEELNEENITLLDKEFITKEFGKQESDIIYEVKSKNKIIYFVLLEIQHKVDRKMAYRILNYMVEIWRKWEKNRDTEEKFVLPKIIPCVLYNGEDKWTAPIELKGLYDDVGEEEDYLVNLKYILIDIFRYKPDDLLKIGNMISSAFYLDTASKDNIEKRFNKLSKSLADMGSEDWKVFMAWAIKMFVIDEDKQEKLEEEILKEEKDMGNLARIGQEIFNDGVIAGRAEGREEGKMMSKVSSIKRILSKKIKSEPTKKIICKLEKLTLEELESIEDRIFEINSWEEIFE